MKGNISVATRDRHLALIECAEKVGVRPGASRYNDKDDFMSFWFTNGVRYAVVFCTPICYLVEHYVADADRPGYGAPEYAIVKNIRNFLFFLKKHKLVSFDEHFAEDSAESDND